MNRRAESPSQPTYVGKIDTVHMLHHLKRSLATGGNREDSKTQIALLPRRGPVCVASSTHSSNPTLFMALPGAKPDYVSVTTGRLSLSLKEKV